MNEVAFNKQFTRFRSKLKQSLATNIRNNKIPNEVIIKRSRWAANAYLGALTAGNPENYCEQIATAILLDGIEI